jgi:hypothetical protein
MFGSLGFAQSSRQFGHSTGQCGPIKTPSSTPQQYHYKNSRRVQSILKSAPCLNNNRTLQFWLDQVIFDTPLDIMLERPLCSKKHWIGLAQQYHPSTYDRKTGKLHLIVTSFFPRQVSGQKTTKANSPHYKKPTKTHTTPEETALH